MGFEFVFTSRNKISYPIPRQFIFLPQIVFFSLMLTILLRKDNKIIGQ